MSKTIVTVYSHNFSVSNLTHNTRKVVYKAASWFDEMEWVEKSGQWSKEWVRSYASHTEDKKTYRFHINILPEFKKLLEKENIGSDEIEFIIEPKYQPVEIELEVMSHITPYEEQVPILEQLKRADPAAKLLGLQTGGGKSLMSIIAAAFWKYRTIFIMKPGYMSKWESDIKKAVHIKDGDIVMVSGTKGHMALNEMIDRIERGIINPKCIILSNATYRNWITAQEKLPAGQYVPGFTCTAEEFMQVCGIGFRVIDEVHQDFHANFKFDLFTHVEQALSLSATLVTRNEYLAKMHKMAYPLNCRCVVPEYKKYIKVVAWMYDFLDDRFLKTTSRGRTSYSHVEFEKSIMRSSRIKKLYFLMVYEMMRRSYLIERKVGERCVVYFATREMCFEATFFFRQLMPGFKIEKFNQGDPYSNLVESDICFATLIKAGTAVDIPNLTVVLNTINIDSIQANDQALGRLRDLKRLYNNDRTPVYMYAVCMNSIKHMMYHRSKKELFKNKALSSTEMHHNVSIG